MSDTCKLCHGTGTIVHKPWSPFGVIGLDPIGGWTEPCNCKDAPVLDWSQHFTHEERVRIGEAFDQLVRRPRNEAAPDTKPGAMRG